jgi:uncharacterized protein (DUF427 family)/acyl-CoA thioesterase
VTKVESAWGKYPDYRIDVVPVPGTARVWFGDLLLAETTSALRLEETKHVDRLYIPESDVNWEHFQANDDHTICPFKGEADYWSLTAVDPPEKNIVWAYRTPFDEVAPIKGHVAFYQERTRIEIDERWAEDPTLGTKGEFPLWGDATDLLHLMDAQPAEDGSPNHYVTPTWTTARNVVEGGQMLGTAIMATAKTIPDQRATFASMIFSKAASFDDPIDVYVDVVKPGRTFSTVEVRMDQLGIHRAAGILLLDSGSPDVIRHQIPMPNVPGPEGAVPYDFRTTGRDLRVVDAAYDPNPDRVGTPDIYTWVKFREAPETAAGHAAFLVQSMTHWTIGASLRPHKGFGEALAHRTLATGIMSIAVNIHEPVDVTQWLLYVNPSIWAGHGLGQGEGHVFTQDGTLVASYTCQAMIRGFRQSPDAMGKDWSNAM